MIVLTTLSLLTFALPVAAAGPQCLEVYPWSELCHGDVGGFLEGMGVGDAVDLPCDVKDCVTIGDGGLPVECLQVYPWSKLCSGDVVGFTCAMVRCDILA